MACPSPAVADTFVGAAGSESVGVATTVDPTALTPIEFTAFRRKEYSTPPVSPVMVAEVAELVPSSKRIQSAAADGLYSTMESAIVALAGAPVKASHSSFTVPGGNVSPLVLPDALRPVGGSGGAVGASEPAAG